MYKLLREKMGLILLVTGLISFYIIFLPMEQVLIDIKTKTIRRIRKITTSELSVSKQIVDFITQSLDDPNYRHALETEPNFNQYLAEFMLEHFKQRAAFEQVSLSGYLEMLRMNSGEQTNLISNLLASLRISPSIYTVGFFWGFINVRTSVIKDYFDSLIPLKVNNKDFEITIKSIAGGNGIELFSAAMVLYDRLESYAREKLGKTTQEAKEWISRWDIKLELSDINTRLLLQAKKGIYYISSFYFLSLRKHMKDLGEDWDYISQLLDKFLLPLKYGKYSVSKGLRSWLEPRYIDLEDKPLEGLSQRERLEWEEQEVVFFLNPVIGNVCFEVRDRLRKVFRKGYPGLFIWNDSALGEVHHEIVPFR
jgi:chemotaxis methyl-accepting protein methylase